MEALARHETPISTSSPESSGIVIKDEVEDCATEPVVVCRKTILSGHHSAIAHGNS